MTLAVNIAQGGSNNVTFRNKIINGACVIDQRNAGASSTAAGYMIDRFANAPQAAGYITWGQNLGSVTPPNGFINYLGFSTTTVYSLSAGDSFRCEYLIEGYNVADLGWGTANAQPITISFWTRSSLTGTQAATLQNSARSRSYPFTWTINSANTWEYKTTTIVGDTTGTWLTTNGIGIRINFNLGCGASGAGTAGSWSSNNYVSATGAVNVVSTSGATMYITGVQLEAGTTASPFEYRQYGTELALCQRYYKKIGGTYAGQNGTGYVFIGSGLQRSTTSAAFGMAFSPTMRATPSVSFDSNVVCSDRTNFDTTLASLSNIAGDGNGMEFFAAFSACGAQFRPMLLSTASGTTGYMDFSSEL